MSLSKRLSIPLVLFLATLLVHIYWFDHPEHSIWLLAPVILLAALYMVHPDIDQWWRQKHPQQIPEGMLKFLVSTLPSFPQLTSVQKNALLTRVDGRMYEMEYHPQGFEDVPQQLQAAVAGHLALLEVLRPTDLAEIGKINKIALYRHPFPSPQYPDHLHASELYLQDGIALFCATHAVEGYRSPQQFPNLILYEFAKTVSGQLGDNLVSNNDLEKVSGFATDELIKHIGLPLEYLDPKALAICFYLCFPESFTTTLPEKASHLKAFLNLNDV